MFSKVYCFKLLLRLRYETYSVIGKEMGVLVVFLFSHEIYRTHSDLYA
jgi:hypothetical protein